MSTLEMCEKLFDTQDVYKLFDVEKTASEKDIKKAYYKLSLLVHPDRVTESQKETANEKFKLLSKLYQMLTDKEKRALYDEQGIIDDGDNFEGRLSNWMELWRNLFKPITEEDIDNYEKSYVGSDLERTDIKKAYMIGRGCMNHMINAVPFMKIEDEPRIQEVVKELIAAGDVPEYEIFTNEPEKKRKKRHRKYAREFKEAKEMNAKILASKKQSPTSSGSSSISGLEQTIMARNNCRENSFNSLMDNLIKKYGNDNDEDDVLDFAAYGKVKKNSKRQSQTKVKEASGSRLRAVNTGKVKKRKN